MFILHSTNISAFLLCVLFILLVALSLRYIDMNIFRVEERDMEKEYHHITYKKDVQHIILVYF